MDSSERVSRKQYPIVEHIKNVFKLSLKISCKLSNQVIYDLNF